MPLVCILTCAFLSCSLGEISSSTNGFCSVLVLVHDVLLAADSLAGWLRGTMHGAGQGCLQAGSQSKQEVVSFLPVFVPMAANFLWEESCAFYSKGKNRHT